MYVYIYICTYIHTCIHTCMHAYMHAYMHALHCTALHCIALHYITPHYITLHYITLHYITYMYTYIHTYMHACMHAYVRMYVRTYAYIYTYVYIYIYTYICSYELRNSSHGLSDVISHKMGARSILDLPWNWESENISGKQWLGSPWAAHDQRLARQGPSAGKDQGGDLYRCEPLVAGFFRGSSHHFKMNLTCWVRSELWTCSFEAFHALYPKLEPCPRGLGQGTDHEPFGRDPPQDSLGAEAGQLWVWVNWVKNQATGNQGF